MNIAECRKRIEELTKERAAIYESKLQAIDAEVTKLQDRIDTICKHHDDFLLVKSDVPEDEYGKALYNSENYIVTCTICGRRNQVYKSYLEKNLQFTFQDLLNLNYEQSKELR